VKNRKLDQLNAGDHGKIEKVVGTGPLIKRILEMGVLPGTHFEVIRRAPLGDPIEIRIKGYNLSLRGNEASNILVKSA
jgi:ferrous iron transport protein A